MNLSIEQIAAACGGKLVLQMRNTGEAVKEYEASHCVSSVVLDSRRATVGGAFVATVGERVDGHKFIPGVFESGVSVVICEKTPEQVWAEHGSSIAAWGNYILVKDSFQALKDIAEFYRQSLSIPVVGITGSVGKTSTKEFIAGVLSERYRVLKTEGNYNNEIGVPLTLLRIDEDTEVAVVEMGISDFGEMHRLSKMARPNICVITNIGQCHLENLGTRDGILKAKSEIFDFMAESGSVCLNGDDDKLNTISEVRGKKPYFFGLGENEDEVVYASDIQSRGLWGSDAVLHMSGELAVMNEDAAGVSAEDFEVQVPLPGRHMVINAAAAACVGRVLGLNKEQIQQGIAKVAAISGRNNLMRLGDYTLIDDCYNANPVSMKAAIDLLQLADTAKTAILGDMFELGENSDELHAGVGAYAAQAGIERIYCVGENAKHMYEAAKAAATRTQSVVYFADRQELEKRLAEERKLLLPVGDTILLKASHGMYFEELIQNKVFG